MHNFCKIMFVLSIIGVLANITLLYMNGININDSLRALLLTVSAISFYTIVKLYKKKRRK